MARNSKISHNDAAEAVAYFNTITGKVERKATRRLGKALNLDSQRRLVEWADRCIAAKFGFPMRALFEVV